MAPSRGMVAHIRRLHVWNKHQIQTQSSPRSLHTTRISLSGHNRWSKIKHDKAKNDAAKNKQRSVFAHEIATASRLFGPDQNSNPRLADLITKAKREGFAKASIEAAIARGQGRSMTGSSLENVTIEAVMPNNVGVVMECETDNKLRTLHDVRNVVKLSGGVSGPSSYLFEKRGRITFAAKDDTTLDQALEAALEAGALDVYESEEGQIIVYTEPEQISVIGKAISQALTLDIADAGVVHNAKPETAVQLPDEESALALCSFIDSLHEKDVNIHSVSINVVQGDLSDNAWREIASRLE